MTTGREIFVSLYLAILLAVQQTPHSFCVPGPGSNYLTCDNIHREGAKDKSTLMTFTKLLVFAPET